MRPRRVEEVHDVDVCVICALPEEADAFIKALGQYYKIVFERAFSRRSRREYRYSTFLNNYGERLTLLVSWPPGYGAVETGLHVRATLEEYHPRFAAMTGFCAGDKRRVKLGDILVADRAFTYDNGKFTREDGRLVYLHDVDTRHINPMVLQFVQLFDAWKPVVATVPRPPSKRQQREWLLCQLLQDLTPRVDDIPLQVLDKNAPEWRRIVHELQEKPYFYLTKNRMLQDKDRIKEAFYHEDAFPFRDPAQPVRYVAPVASGSAVRADDPFDMVRVPVRGTLGIDMEGAAFYRTLADFPFIPSLLVKGVSDYADKEKDDQYHSYAAQVSSLFLCSFIKEYVTSDLMPARRRHLLWA